MIVTEDELHRIAITVVRGMIARAEAGEIEIEHFGACHGPHERREIYYVGVPSLMPDGKNLKRGEIMAEIWNGETDESHHRVYRISDLVAEIQAGAHQATLFEVTP